jgi:hypothetical protein
MKKLIALFSVFFIIVSCSYEDKNDTSIHFELLPIESVQLPTDFYVDTENEIIINFLRPTSCHGFDGFYYEKDELTRIVAIQSFVLERDDCVALTNQIQEQTLKFKPTETGTYLFKFWKGKDTNGDDIFEEISIDVQ